MGTTACGRPETVSLPAKDRIERGNYPDAFRVLNNTKGPKVLDVLGQTKESFPAGDSGYGSSKGTARTGGDTGAGKKELQPDIFLLTVVLVILTIGIVMVTAAGIHHRCCETR